MSFETKILDILFYRFIINKLGGGTVKESILHQIRKIGTKNKYAE